MLPDDDKWYAIETGRSSESVLKKWFKINDTQLVHLLIMWYLVNLQDARCNNKDNLDISSHGAYFGLLISPVIRTTQIYYTDILLDFTVAGRIEMFIKQLGELSFTVNTRPQPLLSGILSQLFTVRKRINVWQKKMIFACQRIRLI